LGRKATNNKKNTTYSSENASHNELRSAYWPYNRFKKTSGRFISFTIFFVAVLQIAYRSQISMCFPYAGVKVPGEKRALLFRTRCWCWTINIVSNLFSSGNIIVGATSVD